MRIYSIFVIAIIINHFAFRSDAESKPGASSIKIDTLYDVNINDCQEKILVQSNDIDNPILLYFHGGPGSSIMFLSHAFSDKLKDHFILVNWDQRGTALSYHEGMDTTKISEDQIFDDALELTRYLLTTYKKQKIFVLGHSFGSSFGLRLITKYPGYFYAYIGVGQVMNWDKSVAIEYKWLHNELEKANDAIGLKRIEKEKFPYIDLVKKYGGYIHIPLNFDSIIKKSPYYFEGYLDLRAKTRKLTESYKNPAPFASSFSLFDIPEVKVPLYFFEGKYDHVIACAPEVVVEFCDKVKAPEKKIIWFDHSGHWPCLEEPDKFQDELINTVLKENYNKPAMPDR